MPLIALDILESKIKELLMVVKHLREENSRLKAGLQKVSETGGDAAALSPVLLAELDAMKKQLEKYKNDRVKLYSKISTAIRQVEELAGKDTNG